MSRKITLGYNNNSRHIELYNTIASRTGLSAPIVDRIMLSMFDFIERARVSKVGVSFGRYAILVPRLSVRKKLDILTFIAKPCYKKHMADMDDDPLNYFTLKEKYENGELQKVTRYSHRRPE